MMDRRTFLGLLGLSLAGVCQPRWVGAIGPRSYFTIAQLRYAGSWNPRPNAIRKLLHEVEKRTSIIVNPEVAQLDATSETLFEYPFLLMVGDRAFDPLSEGAIVSLRRYLLAGGFLLVDSAEGRSDGDFDRCLRRDLRRLFPERELTTLSKDHVCYKSFYLIEAPMGRLALLPYMEGIDQNDRVMVVYSQNDLMGAWSRDSFGSWEYDVFPGGERQREMAYRLGINLVMYSLCTNYKSDQVHIPFILKRRDWRVD